MDMSSRGRSPFQIEVPLPRTNLTVMRETYPAFVAHPGFNAYYFDNANMHKECAVMAIISFCLTLVNIVSIIIAGSLFLKVCSLNDSLQITQNSEEPRESRTALEAAGANVMAYNRLPKDEEYRLLSEEQEVLSRMPVEAFDALGWRQS